jgi:diguanylate cyclase (GGDEF)-like protein
VLQRAAMLDGLTGIPNRRHFDELLEREWRRGMRENRPVSLVLIDVDDFTLYNETHGQQGGDMCLRRIAGELKVAVGRGGDLIARFENDAFAVILPGNDEAGARIVADSLRGRVADLGITHEGYTPEGHVSVSAVYATAVPSRDGSPSDLVAAARRDLGRVRKSHDSGTEAYFSLREDSLPGVG